MRQFYRAVLLDDDRHLVGYVEPGAQLEEHPWIGNHTVQGVERLLPSGADAASRLDAMAADCCGDARSPEKIEGDGLSAPI